MFDLNLKESTSKLITKSLFLIRKQPKIFVVLLITSIASIAFLPQTLGGSSFPWDFYSVSSTGPAFVAGSISSGNWPTWSTFVGGGIPLSSFHLLSLWFPLWWLFGFIDVHLTLNTLAKIQVLFVAFGGLGITALARAHLLRWRWAIIGGIAFIFFGGFFAQASHAETVRGFAMAPWILWAITIPRDQGTWKRLSCLPLLIYLMSTGAYPSFVTSFAQIGAVYLIVELIQFRKVVTKKYLFQIIAFLASGITLLLGAWWAYIDQTSSNLLYRPHPPNFAVRSDTALGPIDFLGLFLDSVAFHDRIIYSWGVGIPVLIGLVGLKKRHFKQHPAVLAAGLYGLFLAIAPKNKFIGDLMVNEFSSLFPGRFSSIEGKVAVAITIIFFSCLGWQSLIENKPKRRHLVLGVYSFLIWGIWLAWEISPRTPGVLVLIILSLLATFALTELQRIKSNLRESTLVIFLIILVIFDGFRSNHIGTMTHSSGQRSWVVNYEKTDLSRRDHAAATLDKVLQNPPISRPSRLPPTVDISSRAHGHPRDSLGLLGLSYNAANYGGFMIKSYWQMVNDPVALEAFQLPWTPWIWTCEDTNCNYEEALKQFDPNGWSKTSQIRTTRYGQESTDYEVNIEEKTILVENEINFPYWETSDNRVKQITHDGVFRAWILEPGTYSFTTRYSDPSLKTQILLLSAGILIWMITVLTMKNWKPLRLNNNKSLKQEIKRTNS